MKAALYIHIPFCRSKCSYCDFFSVPQGGAIPDAYVEALLSDIRFRVKQHGVTSFTSVYLGGGTPSLLSHAQLCRLFSVLPSLVDSFTPDEITVEANPADITGQFLDTLMQCGVSRLSVGIQSTQESVLEKLNRRSDAACIQSCLHLLKTRWVGPDRRLSLDFISGLPSLSDEAFMAGLEDGIASGADHISLYALTLEEGTALYRQTEDGTVQLDDEQNDRQWDRGCRLLKDRGYVQYEVSNFARPACHSRHNCTYWHMEPYIGVGSGGTGSIGSHRWTGTTDIHQYTQFWNSDAAAASDAVLPEEYELLDDAVRETEFLMMGFRLLEGVSADEYRKRFGKDLSERLGSLWLQWEVQGLAHIRLQDSGDKNYALTEQGILLLNQFLVELL